MIIRPPSKNDTAYIVDTWVKSWRGRLMPAERSHANHRTCLVSIAEVLKDAELLVAYDDSDHIDGWICYSKANKDIGNVIRYAYTREGVRHHGVFKDLFAATGFEYRGCTFACPMGGNFRKWLFARGSQVASSLPWILVLEKRQNG